MSMRKFPISPQLAYIKKGKPAIKCLPPAQQDRGQFHAIHLIYLFFLSTGSYWLHYMRKGLFFYSKTGSCFLLRTLKDRYVPSHVQDEMELVLFLLYKIKKKSELFGRKTHLVLSHYNTIRICLSLMHKNSSYENIPITVLNYITVSWNSNNFVIK